MTIQKEIELFRVLTTNMADTFVKKRTDYGQTTTETFEKFGPVSMLIRMHDKIGRLDNLLGNRQTNLVNESIEDTLLDLANYALITILELRKATDNATDVHNFAVKAYNKLGVCNIATEKAEEKQMDA